MNLTVGCSNGGKTFYICDYDTTHRLNIIDLGNLLEMTKYEIRYKLLNEFNGDYADSYDFFFRELSQAKRTLEWIEPIIIANMLANPDKAYNFVEDEEDADWSWSDL